MLKLKAFFLVMILFTVVSSANAATIVVNTVTDEQNTNGQCSLREAITNINNGATTYSDCAPADAYGTSDTINIPAGMYTTASSSYNVAANVSIVGAGAGTTIINGNSLDRVFVIGAYTVSISGVTITGGNTWASWAVGGGGILNTGTLTITNSTISNNVINGDGTSGGGIGNNGTLTVTNSTISGNVATGWWGGGGGGIVNGGALTVTNSTISNNTSNGYYAAGGGGILNGGTLIVTNSTISNNASSGYATAGGGIYNTTTATLFNTIVANQAVGADCVGSIISNGYNLESATSCGFTSTGDRQNTDPLLGLLQDNGGPTFTHALLDGSPAIDIIPSGVNGCGTTITTDQRGISRPQPSGGSCDMGALEVEYCVLPPSGMVSWWGGDNNALDMVGTNNGVLMNGATYAPGKVGEAFSFDGVDDSVEMPGGIGDFGSAAFTVDFWMYAASDPASDAYLMGKSHPDGGLGWDIRFNDATIRVVGVNGWSLNIVSDASATLNAWHHIALSSTSLTVDLYIDGVLKGSSARSAISATSNPFRIGYTTNYGGTVFNGFIDEVEIFNRALFADEIAAIYNAGSAGKCRSCTPPPFNMVSWWDGEGDANDIIGTNHGTLMNGTTFATGKVGQAFSFDGVDDWVENIAPTGLPVGNATRSIDLWFKTPRNLSSSTEAALVQYGTPSGSNMFGLITSVNCPGKLYFFGNSDDLCGTTTILPDTWYHGAVTYDGATLKLYLNGQLENSGSKSLNTVLNANGLTIGLRPGSSNWQGLIDELEVFNRALSADEIAAIYNAGSAGKCFIQQYTLTVTKAGNGTGTVTATGIDCGADCSEAYNTGTPVTLTATPDTGSTFSGWSGDADCSDGSVTLTGDRACTATFTLNTYTLSVSKAGTGTGTVTAAGISCGADCSEIYNYNTAVSMTATPDTGSTFSGWSGDADCSDGSVTLTGDRACTATFTLNTYTLSVSKAGTGTGTVTAAGISCGADCSEIYNYNTAVSMTATPDTGSTFSGWSGDADCSDGSVTMTADRACTATFTAVYSLSGTVKTRSLTLPGNPIPSVPIPGVTITGSGGCSGTTTTDASGNYTLPGISNGSVCTVTPSKTAYAFTPASRTVTINGANVTGQDFTGLFSGTPTYSLSGRVTAGGSPLPNVTITGSGGCSGSTTTAGNGDYTLLGISNGSVCKVTPSMTSYTFAPASRTVTINGANVTGQDFAGTISTATYSISGTVKTRSSVMPGNPIPGVPIPGVTITGSGGCSGTTTTDGSGNYTLLGISNGSVCTVTPSKTDYAFTPVSRIVTINGANVTGQDFTRN